jgi:hypothetical protein
MKWYQVVRVAEEVQTLRERATILRNKYTVFLVMREVPYYQFQARFTLAVLVLLHAYITMEGAILLGASQRWGRTWNDICSNDFG